jgi:hypothetical protein
VWHDRTALTGSVVAVVLPNAITLRRKYMFGFVSLLQNIIALVNDRDNLKWVRDPTGYRQALRQELQTMLALLDRADNA